MKEKSEYNSRSAGAKTAPKLSRHTAHGTRKYIVRHVTTHRFSSRDVEDQHVCLLWKYLTNYLTFC